MLDQLLSSDSKVSKVGWSSTNLISPQIQNPDRCALYDSVIFEGPPKENFHNWIRLKQVQVCTSVQELRSSSTLFRYFWFNSIWNSCFWIICWEDLVWFGLDRWFGQTDRQNKFILVCLTKFSLLWFGYSTDKQTY